MATFGERFQECLRLKNIKQADVLSKIKPFCRRYGVDISRSQLSQYSTDARKPNATRTRILAEALNVSDAWLEGYDVPMERSINIPVAIQAQIIASASKDIDLMNRIEKIQQLDQKDRSKVYGYIDAVYELSISSEDE